MNYIVDNLDKIASFAAGSVVTIVGAFMSPFATQWIARRFARRPAFALSPSRLGSDLKAIVDPLNYLASKNRSLNAQIGAVNFSNIGNIVRTSSGFHWEIDFSPPDIRAAIMQDEKSPIKFFFDADIMSDAYEVRRPTEVSENSGRSIRQVDNVHELLLSMKANVKIYALFKRGSIDKIFPQKTENTSWSNVLDGKELIINDLKNIEISGSGTEILQKARYAWVVVFKNCDTLTLDNLVFGHERTGYCRGGVLRFENCRNIHVKNCDLFGCGTYGLQFDNCKNVEISDSVIRDCAYGILIINETTDIVLSKCRFINNKEFDLINIDGKSTNISIQECVFKNNYSNNFVVKVEPSSIGYRQFFMWDCVFLGNKYLEFSNDADFTFDSRTTIIDDIGFNNPLYVGRD